MINLRIKKIAIYLSLAFLLLFLFVAYSIYKYNLEESLANKNITNQCLSEAVVAILNTYYKENGRYPNQESVNTLILAAGYPGKLGCGETNINGDGVNVLDVIGEKFQYKYLSASLVECIFSNNDDEAIVYMLSDGVKKIIKSEKNLPK